jgi:adenosylcobyric acid synthase
VRLFDDGISIIGTHTGWPCLGVVPWLAAAARLPAEDSVALERLSHARTDGNARIVAVPVYDRIANFDDLDPLIHDPAFDVRFVRPGDALPTNAAIVILPGSKATISDLATLRRTGWDTQLQRLRDNGSQIIGLCGGYQMLGRSIADPLGLEGDAGTVPGLGLLDVETVLAPDKAVREVTGFAPLVDRMVSGYEIHLGETSGADCARFMVRIGKRTDGARSADGKVWGTYLHGGTMLASHVGATIGESRVIADTALDAIAAELDQLLTDSFKDWLLTGR